MVRLFNNYVLLLETDGGHSSTNSSPQGHPTQKSLPWASTQIKELTLGIHMPQHTTALNEHPKSFVDLFITQHAWWVAV